MESTGRRDRHLNGAAQAVSKWRQQNSALRDDPRQVTLGGHVERWIAHRELFGDQGTIVWSADLGGWAFFNRDLLAARNLEIDRTCRRSSVEWDATFLGEHGQHIGTGLVGDVAVRRNSIRADEHNLHVTLANKITCRRIRNDFER